LEFDEQRKGDIQAQCGPYQAQPPQEIIVTITATIIIAITATITVTVITWA
jgi:hypothetical protein